MNVCMSYHLLLLFSGVYHVFKIRFYLGPSIESMAELLKFQGPQDISVWLRANYYYYYKNLLYQLSWNTRYSSPYFIADTLLVTALKIFLVSMILCEFFKLIFEQSFHVINAILYSVRPTFSLVFLLGWGRRN